MTGQGPRIHVLVADDIAEIARLKFEQGDTSGRWRTRFEWQFAKNPARVRERPLGWVIEATDGVICGHQMAIPHRSKVLDSEQYVGFSADTYVSPELRGQGLGRKLFETYFKAQTGGLALTTTANPASEYLWVQKLGAIPIGDLNKGFLSIFRSGPILQEVLIRRFSHPSVTRHVASIAGVIRDAFRAKGLPAVPASIKCEQVTPQDPVLDDLWQRYRDDHRITVVRDRVYRVWRYGDVPGPKPSIWLVRDAQRDLQAWFSLRVAVRGIAQVKICELLDVFGSPQESEFQSHVLACAVRVGHGTGADAMEIKGLHRSWRLHLSSLGFVTRMLPSNPFLCKNMGAMDETTLHGAESWHLCSADGDAGLGGR